MHLNAPIVETGARPAIHGRNGHGHHKVVDYSLHGLVTLRLIDPPKSATAKLVKLLGQSVGTPSPEPDITVRFVDSLPVEGDLRYIGLHSAAFDAAHFYVVDEDGSRARIDFEALGGPCEIVCERGVSAVPLLIPIVGLTLLARGYVLLHSGAFVYGGVGVLVTGWEKGGKTETLLPFMQAGADYMSDEWTIVSPGDGLIRGVSAMTQVWSWHFRQLPEFWARIPAADRFRIRVLRAYQAVYTRTPGWLRPRGLIGGWFEKLSTDGGVPLLGQSRSAPERLFGDRIRREPARLERLFFATMKPGDPASGTIEVLPVEPDEIARRMVASLAYERRALIQAYEQFRFAFPGRSNALLDSSRERELALLEKAFSGITAYEVRHPYPVRLGAMRQAMMPYVQPEQHS